MWICSSCSENLEDQFDCCWSCGFERPQGQENRKKKSTAPVENVENSNPAQPESDANDALLGFVEGLAGHAAKVDLRKLQQKLNFALASGEDIELGCKAHRHYIIFTNKRVLFIDFHGLTGIKAEYHSIQYKSITRFSIKTAGMMDLDVSLVLWLTGTSEPIEESFPARIDIFEIQSVLVKHC